MHRGWECGSGWEVMGEKSLWIGTLWDFACQIEEFGFEPKGSEQLFENFEQDSNRIIAVLEESCW